MKRPRKKRQHWPCGEPKDDPLSQEPAGAEYPPWAVLRDWIADFLRWALKIEAK